MEHGVFVGQGLIENPEHLLVPDQGLGRCLLGLGWAENEVPFASRIEGHINSDEHLLMDTLEVRN